MPEGLWGEVASMFATKALQQVAFRRQNFVQNPDVTNDLPYQFSMWGNMFADVQCVFSLLVLVLCLFRCKSCSHPTAKHPRGCNIGYCFFLLFRFDVPDFRRD